MMRGKPKPSREHDRYIESVAASLIQTAGQKYERFIKN